ncbi:MULTISPECIES: PQQ-dependent sugar dehydrogenase [Microbacterium]|uniref:PQQ-dependent sugar dehydrogenase n=1 Tax=Microbacterium TaxID=33882 RepID=UPI00048AEED3|nr:MULTISPECIES: PQQ-dependent sugar dehydrogenase [Microbacterium]
MSPRGRLAGTRPRRTAAAAFVLATACWLTGCGVAGPDPPPPPPPAASPSAAPTSEPVTIVTGLAAPWSLVRIGTSVLISERDTGRIRELTTGGALRDVVTVENVAHGGEGGLLGLAFDGDDGLFVYSTAADGNRIERYAVAGAPGALRLTDPRIVVDGLPRAGNHNGGRIAFGPDGMLYVPVGDAGDPDAAQDPDALNGKILRLEPDGGIPADNPRRGSPVYTLGHRNVQGLAWAPDGRMFASEFGQNTWDELNEIVPGGNYGWPVVEGTGGEERGFVDPLQSWATDAASPSGIAVIGDRILIANLRGEVLRSVPLSDTAASEEFYARAFGRLRDVFAGPDGAVWVLTNNTDGRGSPRDGDDRIIAVPPALLD